MVFQSPARGWARSITVAFGAFVLGVPQLLLVARPATADPVARVTKTATHVSWSPCRYGFQCATVRVPQDYDRPDGVTVSLAVIRLPAAVPRQRIGSLFINPGGPGGSVVDYIRQIAQFVPLQVRARFDIVGFDPRGIMRSTPLRCFDTLAAATSVLPPFPFPVTSREENAQQKADRALAGACASHGGPILDHMSTADVARDMDFLRQAVGDRKLNYVGFSYGSFLGQTYANLFPDRIRALVIDGVLDPVAWTTGRGQEATTLPFSARLRSDVGSQQTLGEFFRLCDAAGSDCKFSGHARQRYAALAQRLRRHPIKIYDSAGHTLLSTFTYADLIAATLGALYTPVTWPDLAVFLADIEAQAKTTGRALAAVRSGLGLDVASQEPYPNIVEGASGVACSDSINPKPPTAWPRAAATAEREDGYFGRLWTWISDVCQPWPSSAGQDRYLGPWTARTASPVLVVGNYFDPATRYQGAVTASRLLPRSRLLSYAGWGHTAFLSQQNYCIDSNVTRYLLTTRIPPAGTVCRPQGTPFGPTEATARARAKATIGAALLPPAVRHARSGG